MITYELLLACIKLSNLANGSFVLKVLEKKIRKIEIIRLFLLFFFVKKSDPINLFNWFKLIWDTQQYLWSDHNGGGGGQYMLTILKKV